MSFHDNPLVDSSSERSEESENFVRSLFSRKRGFLTQKDEKDYGVDFTVKLTLKSQVLTFSFPIQVKSNKEVKIVDISKESFVSYSIRTSRLGFLCRHNPSTGIIIIYDDTNSKCYFDYVDNIYTRIIELKKSESWKSQETVTIHIPVTNILSPNDSLQDIHSYYLKKRQLFNSMLRNESYNYGLPYILDEIPNHQSSHSSIEQIDKANPDDDLPIDRIRIASSWKELFVQLRNEYLPLQIFPIYIPNSLKLNKSHLGFTDDYGSLTIRDETFFEEYSLDTTSEFDNFFRKQGINQLERSRSTEVINVPNSKGNDCSICKLYSFDSSVISNQFNKKHKGEQDKFIESYYQYMCGYNLKSYRLLSEFVDRKDTYGFLASRNLKKLRISDQDKNEDHKFIDDNWLNVFLNNPHISSETKYIYRYVEQQKHWNIQYDLVKEIGQVEKNIDNFRISNVHNLIKSIYKLDNRLKRLFKFITHNYLFNDLEYGNITKLYETILFLQLKCYSKINDKNKHSLEYHNVYIYLLLVQPYPLEKAVKKYRKKKVEMSNLESGLLEDLDNIRANLKWLASYPKQHSPYLIHLNNYLCNIFLLTEITVKGDMIIPRVVQFINDIIRDNRAIYNRTIGSYREFILRNQKLLNSEELRRALSLTEERSVKGNSNLIFDETVLSIDEIMNDIDSYSVFDLHKLENRRSDISEYDVSLILEKRIRANFMFNSCRLAIVLGYLEYDDYKVEILSYLTELKKEFESSSDYFTRTGYVFSLQQFISIAFKCNLDLNRTEYMRLCPDEPYFTWLFNIESFDYNEFDIYWILEYESATYFEKFKQIPQIMFKVQEFLKKNNDQNINNVYWNYLHDTK